MNRADFMQEIEELFQNIKVDKSIFKTEEEYSRVYFNLAEILEMMEG